MSPQQCEAVAACRLAVGRVLGWDAIDHLGIYRAAGGEPILAVARRRRDEGGKDVRTLHPLGLGAWAVGDPPGPLPLYGLPALLAHGDREVVVVEGERKADALQAVLDGAACVTTWPHGALAVRKADWSPLRGRSVFIWPDHDRAGLDAARQVAACALAAGARVARIVPLSAVAAARTALGRDDNVPEGWDAADAIAEGWTLSQVANLLATAERFTPEPDPDAPPRLVLRDHADRLHDHKDPPPMLVADLLPFDGLGAIVALPGVGKSLIATELTRCIAAGAPFAGRATMSGRVVYACPDASSSTERRMLALPEDAAWRVLTVPDLPRLPAGMAVLRDTMAELVAAPDPVRLLVIDTFDASREHSDGSYAAQDGLMESIFDPLKKMAKSLGMAVLVIHHVARGDQGRPRGSMVIEARADFIGVVDGMRGCVILDSGKARDEDKEPLGIWRITPVDVNGKKVPTLEYAPEEQHAAQTRTRHNDRAVIDALAGWPADQDAPTKVQLSQRSGVPLGSLGKIMERLRAQGLVDGVIYRLTDAGRGAADHIPLADEP